VAQEAVETKHNRLYEELSRAITRGVFAPGQKLPTEADLMRQYGVSRTTVTRTLRDLEHHGVIWRRQGSGTFVKELERAATEQYGMIVHGVEPGSIFIDIYETLVRAAGRAGALLSLTHLSNEADRVGEAVESVERMIGQGVRGVFYLPHAMTGEGDLVNRRVTEALAGAGVPVVLLDRDVCEFPRRSVYDLVGVDNARGGYLLGQHMVDVGCRRPMFFSCDVAFSSARERWIGYRAAMEANGVEPRLFECDPRSAAEVMGAVRDGRPDGIVCDNDVNAAMVMRHLLNARVGIPGEVRLAGFDDTPTASLLAVPLTTVRQPSGAIAMRAVSLMNDRRAHPNLPPAHVAVHCELVVRESTAGAGGGTSG
jgi:DNA-binding LacI/PurR family transcriptional regulator